MITDERCVVVGSGPAGLCAAWSARRRGLQPLVLDAAVGVGGAWRLLPPTLRCLSDRHHDVFPGGDYPTGPGDRATAAEVVAAAERFQRRSRFRVQGGVRVLTVEVQKGWLALVTDRGRITTRTMVVATGEFGAPKRPDLPGSFTGTLVHFHDFKAETVGPGHSVVVVGAGNSGADVVRECLRRGALVTLSTPRPVPRPLPIPPRAVREILFLLSAAPVDRLPGRGGCTDSTAVVDSDLFDAVRDGRVRTISRAVRLVEDGVQGALGETVRADHIVLCTGFRRETSWLAPAITVNPENGFPCHDAGLSPEVKGVGFVGIPCMRTRRSGFLRGFAQDAEAVVARLVKDA